MKSIRPITVLRLTALLMCVLMGIGAVYGEIYSVGVPPKTLADLLVGHWHVAARTAVQAFGFILFGILLLTATQERFWLRTSWENWCLLGLQSAVALFFEPDLLYFVASEVTFLLPIRSALMWILLQSLAEVGTSICISRFYGVSPVPELQGVPDSLLWSWVIAYDLLWYLAAFSVGMLGSSGARQARELAAANAELRATQELASETARVADRVHLARELHDSVGHHLTALSIHLQVATHLAENTEPRLKEKIDQSHLVTRVLLGEIRNMVSGWNGSESVALRPALEALAEQIDRPRIAIQVEPGAEQVSPALGHTLFRVVQELITNALRHSRAESISVRACKQEQVYQLIVSDDGMGRLPVSFGIGLHGIRQRLTAVSGNLAFEENQPQGLRAVVRIPLNKEGGTA